MANTFFKFKKFTVYQDSCAMKVTTDACIQGAWTSLDKEDSNVLDIGCGTGLLSLMLAQRYPKINIVAVEIDKDAAFQAQLNIKNSPYKNRISIENKDIRFTEFPNLFDFIICNPPFFDKDLKTNNDLRNKAHHSANLNFSELILIINKFLNYNGSFSILLPIREYNEWESVANENGWYLYKKLNIKPIFDKKINRVVGIFSRENAAVENEELIIYAQKGKYSEEAIKLLQEFYLNV